MVWVVPKSLSHELTLVGSSCDKWVVSADRDRMISLLWFCPATRVYLGKNNTLLNKTFEVQISPTPKKKSCYFGLMMMIKSNHHSAAIS